MTAAAVTSEIVQKVPMFRGLSEEEARHVATIIGVAEYGPKETVIEQGAEPATVGAAGRQMRSLARLERAATQS